MNYGHGRRRDGFLFIPIGIHGYSTLLHDNPAISPLWSESKSFHVADPSTLDLFPPTFRIQALAIGKQQQQVYVRLFPGFFNKKRVRGSQGFRVGYGGGMKSLRFPCRSGSEMKHVW